MSNGVLVLHQQGTGFSGSLMATGHGLQGIKVNCMEGKLYG